MDESEKEIKMLESKFQSDLKKELKNKFPGCIVMKADSADIQGIPDLLILYKDKWASLEVKKNKKLRIDQIRITMLTKWKTCHFRVLYIQRIRRTY